MELGARKKARRREVAAKKKRRNERKKMRVCRLMEDNQRVETPPLHLVSTGHESRVLVKYGPLPVQFHINEK